MAMAMATVCHVHPGARVTNVPTFTLDMLFTVVYIIGAGSGKRIPQGGRKWRSIMGGMKKTV
jgi:hypothetical protein